MSKPALIGVTPESIAVPALSAADFTAMADADGGVHVRLSAVQACIVVRGKPASMDPDQELAARLGVAFPERLCFTEGGEIRLRWLSPDEYLLSCPLVDLDSTLTTLREHLKGSFAVSDVSGGYVAFELGGASVLDVLARSTSYDVHPRSFPVGRSAATVFGKSTATISHVAAGRYEIICRRSFAAYVASWVSEAAREQGLRLAD